MAVSGGGEENVTVETPATAPTTPVTPTTPTTPSEPELTKAPTCTESGVWTTVCTTCGETMTEEAAALGHDYKTTTTASSCKVAGSEVTTCSRCGDSSTKVLPLADHSYGKNLVCTVCGTASPDRPTSPVKGNDVAPVGTANVNMDTYKVKSEYAGTVTLQNGKKEAQVFDVTITAEGLKKQESAGDTTNEGELYYVGIKIPVKLGGDYCYRFYTLTRTTAAGTKDMTVEELNQAIYEKAQVSSEHNFANGDNPDQKTDEKNGYWDIYTPFVDPNMSKDIAYWAIGVETYKKKAPTATVEESEENVEAQKAISGDKAAAPEGYELESVVIYDVKVDIKAADTETKEEEATTNLALTATTLKVETEAAPAENTEEPKTEEPVVEEPKTEDAEPAPSEEEPVEEQPAEDAPAEEQPVEEQPAPEINPEEAA